MDSSKINQNCVKHLLKKALKKSFSGDFSLWENAQADEETVLHYKSKYLEILSSHLFPSEEFTFDIVDSSDQLDFSVLQIARKKSSLTTGLEQ